MLRHSGCHHVRRCRRCRGFSLAPRLGGYMLHCIALLSWANPCDIHRRSKWTRATGERTWLPGQRTARQRPLSEHAASRRQVNGRRYAYVDIVLDLGPVLNAPRCVGCQVKCWLDPLLVSPILIYQFLRGTVHNVIEMPSVTALHTTLLRGNSKDRVESPTSASQEAINAGGRNRPVSNRTTYWALISLDL